MTIKAADTEIYQSVIPTGKTVGEPNSDWVIDSYESHRIGTVNFPKPGIYEIELKIEVAKKEEVISHLGKIFLSIIF